MARTTHAVSVAGRKITLSNLDKVLYPGAGFTKGQVIDYYTRVADYILPHLRNRPVTLKRYPNGVDSNFFYAKNAPKSTPEFVEIARVPRREGGADIRYVVIDNLPTLVWCANLAALELHPFLHRTPHIDQPSSIVFDLDPGEGTDILDCAKVAFLVRDVFGKFGLECFAKVSGSKGLQVYVPLNGNATYEKTRPLARCVAESLAEECPDLVIAEMAKAVRKGKVFIDWSQNSDFKTTVGAYSLRAKGDEPYVSAPVTWEELEELRPCG